jgi:hypothetical protein
MLSKLNDTVAKFNYETVYSFIGEVENISL